MEEMIDVLRRIWSKQTNGEKPYFCVSTKRVADGKWKDHFFRWPHVNELREILEEHPTEKFNLYFCPLPLLRPYRRKEYVMGSAMLWADIDEARPEDMKIKPHVLWASSPGRFAGLWFTERWLNNEECNDYNQRMTYGVGADKAGWDLTQVLRIPGTRNHKYEGSPEGRMIRFKIGERVALKDVPRNVAKTSAGRALETYKTWENKLRGETRSILTARVASVGKRSDVLWKLYHQLFDAGVPLDQIRLLVKESVWNKWRGRHSEDRQLDRDIEKCLKEKLAATAEASGVGDSAALAGAEEIYEGVSAADVTCSAVDWIWWPYISRGALTILEGDPGLGKSYFMQMVAGAVCDGGELPGDGGMRGREKIKAGGVFYFSVEDDAGTVIVPRLRANGVKNLSRFRIYDRKMTMDEGGLAVAEYLVERHKVDLVVFDTLNYFVGGIDVHRSNEVSQQMEHFQRLASKHKVAVVVLRHLTKGSAGAGVKALYRGQGSMAFSGSAREVLTVGIHPEDNDLKIVAVTKLNLEAKPKALGFRILPGKGGQATFEFSDDLYELTSDDIVDVRATSKSAGRPNNERGDAVKFLEERLKDGPMESDKLDQLAEAHGVSLPTLRRAKKELNVVAEKRGFNPTRWFWRLP